MLEAMVKLIKKYRKRNISLKNTFDILRPVNITSYVLGFRIFEYPRGHSRSRLSFLYTMTLCCIYYNGWYHLGLLLKSSKAFNLQAFLYNIAAVINQIAIFVVVIMGFHQTKSLKLSARRIHEIDITLRALGSPPSFNIIYKRTMTMISFVFFYLTTFALAQTYVYQPLANLPFTTVQTVSSLFVQIYGQSIEFILIIEFLTIVGCIRSEFQRVNDLLKDFNVLPLSSIAMELLDQNESNDPLSMNKCLFASSNKLFTLPQSSQRLRSHLQLTSHDIIRSRRLLQTIRQIHLELYRISKSIGIIYGVQISIEMGLCILYTTYYIYNIYDICQLGTYNGSLLIVEIVGACLLCFNNAIKIFGVNYTCEKTSSEAKSTNEIIYTFYGQSMDYEIHKEINVFSLQMIQCRPSYSAFGLYSLNCRNVCSCIGIITTYVVIMIQVTSSIMDEIT